jgi:hypothetical protein
MELWVVVSSFLFVALLCAGGFVFLGYDARRTFRHGRELDVLMARHTQEIIERGDRETRALMDRMHADTQVLMRMILERTDRGKR